MSYAKFMVTAPKHHAFGNILKKKKKTKQEGKRYIYLDISGFSGQFGLALTFSNSIGS